MTNFSTSLLVVAAALIDENRDVLMHRRRMKAVHGGLWEFPGGKVEPGEAPEMAMIRELAEELGVTVDTSDLCPIGFASGPGEDGGPLVILLYSCERWGGNPQCLDGEEIAWLAIETVPSLDMPPLDHPLAAQLVSAWRNNSL